MVDQLFDLTDRVSGPNGMNLSIVYEQVQSHENSLDVSMEFADLRMMFRCLITCSPSSSITDWPSNRVKSANG